MKKIATLFILFFILISFTSCSKRNESNSGSTVATSGTSENASISYELPEFQTVSTSDAVSEAKSEQETEKDREHSDLPDTINWDSSNTDNSNNCVYIPGEGTYLIQNKKLVKYLKGESISLPGGSLNWKTDDFNQPVLHYFESSNQLFMITTTQDEFPNTKKWLYVFEDYNKSEVKFLGECKVFAGTQSEITDFVYQDENGVSWRYNGDIFVEE